MRRAAIFSSDMIMISYFNININIITVIDPTFRRGFKIVISLSSLVITSSLFKYFFIASLRYLLSFIILLINLLTALLPKYDLKGFLSTYHQDILIYSHNFKQYIFDIARIRLFWILFSIIFWY